MRFSVIGCPKVLQRHRHTKRGFTYDPSVQDKKAFALQASVYKPGELIEKPLRIALLFYFKRPKSHFRTGKYSHLLKNGMESRWMVGSKDLDNLVKLVCDSLEGIFYKNDSLICHIEAQKLYCADGDEPRTVVGIQIL